MSAPKWAGLAATSVALGGAGFVFPDYATNLLALGAVLGAAAALWGYAGDGAKPEPLSDSATRALALLSLRAKQAYNREEEEHEARLVALWDGCFPDGSRPLPSRLGRHWGDIGFQGEDPATDFRGMGVLGLDVLLHLVTAQRELYETVHRGDADTCYYPIAIAGINLASSALTGLARTRARANFLFPGQGEDTVAVFADYVCQVWYTFDVYYQEAIRTYLEAEGGVPELCVMQFAQILARFEEHMLPLV